MSDQASARGIILAHGSMAHGLADAVGRISGVGDALVAISNEGKSPDAIRAELEAALEDGPAIVFTDLQTGSCALVARLVCERLVGAPVVCGANLPMLLDFVFHREMPLEDLVERLVRKGQEGVQVLSGGRVERADRPLPG